MIGESLSLLFDDYVQHLKMANGTVVIPIHQGSACKPELSWVYRGGNKSLFPHRDWPLGSPCIIMPTEDLIGQILYYVGDFGGLQGIVEDGVIVTCDTMRHHVPPRKRNRNR